MKPKFRIFHLPIFIIGLLGAAFTLFLYFISPRDSLHQYALTLEAGQLVSADGYVWAVESEEDGSLRVNILHAVGGKNFFEQQNSKNTAWMPANGADMAILVFGNEMVFLRSDGSIWNAEERDAETAELSLYAWPAEDMDYFGIVRRHDVDVTYYHRGRLISAEFEFEAQRDDPYDYSSKLAAKTFNGWYYLAETNASCHNVFYIDDEMGTVMHCSVSFKRLKVPPSPTRIDIIDERSGKVAASMGI